MSVTSPGSQFPAARHIALRPHLERTGQQPEARAATSSSSSITSSIAPSAGLVHGKTALIPDDLERAVRGRGQRPAGAQAGCGWRGSGRGGRDAATHAAPAGPGGPATRSNPLPASTTTARSSPTPRTPPPADRADGYRGAGGRTVGGAVVVPGPLLRARKPWRNRIHSLAVVPAHPQLSARDCAVGDRGIVGPRAADVGRSGDVHTAAVRADRYRRRIHAIVGAVVAPDPELGAAARLAKLASSSPHAMPCWASQPRSRAEGPPSSTGGAWNSATRRPPVLPTCATHSSPRSRTTCSNSGGLRSSIRLLQTAHDHSSEPSLSVLVRVIWCGVDNRTPIVSERCAPQSPTPASRAPRRQRRSSQPGVSAAELLSPHL